MTEKHNSAPTPIPNSKLRLERERRAWSQSRLADEVGTTPLNISRWERGINQPGPHFRSKLCELFSMTAQQLGLVADKSEQKQAESIIASTPEPVHSTTVPSALWNVAYRRNPFFTGREEILAQLHETLRAGDHQPIALAQPQAISGLGGIGKTQTAVEYAYRFREDYEAVFWTRADSYDLLASDFLTIAHLLELPQRNDQEQDTIIQAVIRWFDTHNNWLLILDNADDLDLMLSFLPTAGKGHVLLTTRAQALGTMAQRIEMEKMNLEEGTLFLLRRIKRIRGTATPVTTSDSYHQARAIVEAVDGLPLALDQAGAYIEETGCSLADYLKFYKTRRTRLLRVRGRDVTGHPEPVATTWSLSFEKVERANPAAAELLKLCAFLHPDAIPESMISEGATELGPILGPIAADELDLNEAIGELHKYSLIKRDTEEHIINIHRLVQVVVKDEMTREGERGRAERVVKMMNKVFPEAEKAEMWHKCQQYLPHTQICNELGVADSLAKGELLHKSGNYLRSRALYKEAEINLQSSLEIRKHFLGLEHPDVATSIDDLAQIYHNQGKYEKAEALYQQALKIREYQLGQTHLGVSYTLNHLGKLYNDQGKYRQAEALFQRALAISEENLGVNHHNVAAILDNLAWLSYDQSKYGEAEILYLRALTIREQALGTFHLDVGQTLNNLGVLYWQQGKYKQAESLLLRTLSIYEGLLGKEHPDIGNIYNNLAGVYYGQGLYEQAIPLLLRAIAIHEQTLGQHHPILANSLNELGIVYRNQEKYEQAKDLFKRAIAIRELSLGYDHPELTKSLGNLANIYRLQGMYDESEALYMRTLTICERKLDPNHVLTASFLWGLGRLYVLEEKYEQAESLFLKAIDIYETIKLLKHSNNIKILEEYSSLLYKMERADEAAALEARAQIIRAKQEET